MVRGEQLHTSTRKRTKASGAEGEWWTHSSLLSLQGEEHPEAWSQGGWRKRWTSLNPFASMGTDDILGQESSDWNDRSVWQSRDGLTSYLGNPIIFFISLNPFSGAWTAYQNLEIYLSLCVLSLSMTKRKLLIHSLQPTHHNRPHLNKQFHHPPSCSNILYSSPFCYPEFLLRQPISMSCWLCL